MRNTKIGVGTPGYLGVFVLLVIALIICSYVGHNVPTEPTPVESEVEAKPDDITEMDVVSIEGVMPSMIIYFDTLSRETNWKVEVQITPGVYINKEYLPTPEDGESVVGIGYSIGGTEVLIAFQFDSVNNTLTGTEVGAVIGGNFNNPGLKERLEGEVWERVRPFLFAQYEQKEVDNEGR